MSHEIKNNIPVDIEKHCVQFSLLWKSPIITLSTCSFFFSFMFTSFYKYPLTGFGKRSPEKSLQLYGFCCGFIEQLVRRNSRQI